MPNRNILLGSIALVAVVGLALATLANSSYPLFSGEASQTTSTITEIGKTVVTSTTGQRSVLPQSANITGTIYRTSVFSHGFNFTMEYNATSLRIGEHLALRFIVVNVNQTEPVGVHWDQSPMSFVVSNSSGPVYATGEGSSYGLPVFRVYPDSRFSSLIDVWATARQVTDNRAKQLLTAPVVSPGTYWITSKAVLLDPEDGHQLFTIEMQPVTIEVLPS